jgi:hypothetical protein
LATAGGYWLNLAEAQKLTQTMLVPGIIEENNRRGGILSMLPLAQELGGTDIAWNRSKGEREAKFLNIGSDLVWTDNVDYRQLKAELYRIYDQTVLDKFVSSVYGTHNNYEVVTLQGLRHGMIKKLEDAVIYADTTYPAVSGVGEPDGLHAWSYDAGAGTGGGTGTDTQAANADLDIDEGEGALSIENLRILEDAMKHGIDALLMPYQIARRIDAFFAEKGNRGDNASAVGSYIWSDSAMIGMKVPMWNGIPIIRSDYMVAEQANTGVGADARAKYTSGTKNFSILALKFGQVRENNPGLTLGFGGKENSLGELFRMDYFEKLEHRDGSGMRMIGYFNLMAGSSMSVGRIRDITDAAVTV